MSAFSATEFDSDNYFKYRPSYDDSFFKYIFNYYLINFMHKQKKHDFKKLCIVDLGSGPGTNIISLIDVIAEFKVRKFQIWQNLNNCKIIVTDVSENMLNEAKLEINKKLDRLDKEMNDFFDISYLQCSGETIDLNINSNTVDLVLAAECVHWMNKELMFKSVSKVLKNDIGVYAYWGYVDPVFVEYNKKTGDDIEKANKIYEDFVYEGEGKLGEFWEQPGRGNLRSLYKDMNNYLFNEINKKTFDNILSCYRFVNLGVEIVESLEDNFKDELKIDNEALKICKEMKFENYLKYIDTWSSSYKWNKEHSKEESVSKLFWKEINDTLKWDINKEVKIEFKTVYTFCCKR